MRNRLITFLAICISMLLVFGIPIAVRAASKVPLIQLNNKLFVSPKGEPEPYLNRDGRTMVPVRLLSEALGVPNDKEHIKWDQVNNHVLISKDAIKIDIGVGNKNLLVNSNTIEMDTKAEIKNDRVFIPLRFIAEALGSRVIWDKKTNEINILTDRSNDFLQYNLANIVGAFPVSLNGEGFQLSINDTLIYPYDSEDSKVLLNTYGLKPDSSGTPYYLVWMSITLSNSGTGIVESSNALNAAPISFGFNPVDQNIVLPLKPKSEYDVVNNSEILYKWHLEKDQKISSHIALILTQKDIKRFFVKTDKENITLAIRQS